MASKPKKNTPKQSNAWLEKLKRETEGEINMFKTSKFWAFVQLILISIAIVAGIGFYFGAQYANNQKEVTKQEATVLAKELVAQSKTQ